MAKKDTDEPHFKGCTGRIVEDADKEGAAKINLLLIPLGVDEDSLKNLS